MSTPLGGSIPIWEQKQNVSGQPRLLHTHRHLHAHTHLFIELKMCEGELHSLPHFLFLDVHSSDVRVHYIWLLIWGQKRGNTLKVTTIKLVQEFLRNKVQSRPPIQDNKEYLKWASWCCCQPLEAERPPEHCCACAEQQRHWASAALCQLCSKSEHSNWSLRESKTHRIIDIIVLINKHLQISNEHLSIGHEFIQRNLQCTQRVNIWNYIIHVIFDDFENSEIRVDW